MTAIFVRHITFEARERARFNCLAHGRARVKTAAFGLVVLVLRDATAKSPLFRRAYIAKVPPKAEKLFILQT